MFLGYIGCNEGGADQRPYQSSACKKKNITGFLFPDYVHTNTDNDKKEKY